MTLSTKSYIEQVIRCREEDHRVPVLVLTSMTPDRVLQDSLAGIETCDLSKLHVFMSQAPVQPWPSELRVTIVATDELDEAQGCLCCSIKSELATALSTLFLRLLRRQEPRVALVLVVTQATDASVMQQSLKHAPFLGQRYRLLSGPR